MTAGQPLTKFQWTKPVHALALVLPGVTNTFYLKHKQQARGSSSSETSWHLVAPFLMSGWTAAAHFSTQVPEFLPAALPHVPGRYYRLDKVRLLVVARSSWQKPECYCVFSFDWHLCQSSFYFLQGKRRY